MGNAGSMDQHTDLRGHNMPLKLPMPEPEVDVMKSWGVFGQVKGPVAGTIPTGGSDKVTRRDLITASGGASNTVRLPGKMEQVSITTF
ncbi:hypothetical protein Q8A73_010095 [Channa argus]|nr:hypothetical protein Q8A73_010095 [Channa argus]